MYIEGYPIVTIINIVIINIATRLNYKHNIAISDILSPNRAFRIILDDSTTVHASLGLPIRAIPILTGLT